MTNNIIAIVNKSDEKLVETLKTKYGFRSLIDNYPFFLAAPNQAVIMQLDNPFKSEVIMDYAHKLDWSRFDVNLRTEDARSASAMTEEDIEVFQSNYGTDAGIWSDPYVAYKKGLIGIQRLYGHYGSPAFSELFRIFDNELHWDLDTMSSAGVSCHLGSYAVNSGWNYFGIGNNLRFYRVYISKDLLPESVDYVDIIDHHDLEQSVPDCINDKVEETDIVRPINLESIYVSAFDLKQPENENSILVSSLNENIYRTADDYLVYGSEELYWCDSEQEYYYFEENMPSQVDSECNFSYHAISTMRHESSEYRSLLNDYPAADYYRVGFEVEKVDYDLVTSYYADDLLRETQYRKECDASLDSGDGYELISPMYAYDVDFIEKQIKSMNSVCELLNGTTTSKCGTHITISKYAENGSYVFNKLVNWLPVLSALYPNRVHNEYCEAVVGKSHYNYTRKYRPIRLDDDKIEVRIFPATRTVDQLLWRLRLVRIMLDLHVASMRGIRKYVLSGKLHNHLDIIYKQDETLFNNLLVRANRHARRFEIFDSNNLLTPSELSEVL